ncbi:MAG: translocation/assembly module TamB [Deltaproteobacteria bacterium]|jgi:translocation and assembly module TamB|nr:translocation/assembly module TamB [Deltaproteobacteria bacterium]
MKKPGRCRKIIIGLLALPVLLAGLVLGAMLFLRTDAGTEFILSQIQKALAKSQLFLKAASFQGPLPQKILASGVTLADRDGVFLSARDLEINISLAPLLSGLVKARLNLSGADFSRLPSLPAKEKDDPPFSLPAGLEIAFVLTDNHIQGAVLNPQNPGPQTLVNLQGQVHLKDARLSFGWDGTILDQDGRGLSGQGQLGPESPGQPENLNLNLTFQDIDGRLTGPRPDLPRILALTLQGCGPLTDWNGQLELQGRNNLNSSEPPAVRQKPADPNEPYSPEILAAARINLKTQTGRLFEDLIKNPSFSLDLSLGGLAKLIPPEKRSSVPCTAPLPPESHLSLTAEISAQKSDVQGRASLATPYLNGEISRLTIADSENRKKLSAVMALVPGSLWELPDEAYNLELEVSSEGHKITVHALNIKARGFDSQITASAEPESQTVKANVKVSAGSPLYSLIKKIAPDLKLPGEVETEVDFFRDPANNRYKASGQIALADLSPLMADWAGPLNLKYDLAGPPDDIDLSAALNSPALSTPAGPWTELELGLSGHYQKTADPPKTEDPDASLPDGPLKDRAGSLIRASLTARAQTRENPLELTAEVKFEKKENDFSLDISDFLLNAPGISARSSGLKLAVISGKPPEMDGQLSADVSDWAFLGQISGQAIEGSPASLDIKSVKEPVPAAEALLKLPEFKLNQTVYLKDVNLSVASQAADKADLILKYSQGPGRAGPLVIKNSQISVTGHGLWSRGLAGEAEAKVMGEKGELLNLSASYDLSNRTAVIKRLFLRPPQLTGPVSVTEEVRLSFKDGLDIDSLSASVGQSGQLTLGGHYGGGAPLKIRAEAKALPLNLLAGGPELLSGGLADFKVDLGQATGGTFEISSSLRSPRPLTIKAGGRLSGSSLTGQAEVSWPRSARPVKAAFSLPLKHGSKLPVPDNNGRLEAEVSWQGPADQVWAFTGLEAMDLKGEVDLKLNVLGSLSQPKPELNVYLAKGGFQDPTTGFALTGLNLSGHMDARGEIKVLAEATDGGAGRLALEGAVNPRASPPHLKARAQISHLSPIHRDDIDLTVSSLATLEGPLSALKLKSKTIIEKAEISLAQGLGGPSVSTLDLGTETENPASPLEMDLSIEIPRRFYIRGRGLDSEWQGQLKLTGAANKPLIAGTIKPVRGYLELLAQQFTITNGEVRFYDTSTTINPSLNLELTRETNEITAIIRLSGTKMSPHLSLESQPPRPPDEVLAQILFGKNTSQLSRLETLQLANSLRSLTGMSSVDIFSPLNTVRDTLGLSVLRFGESTSGGDHRILQGNSFRDNLNLDDEENSQAETAATIEAGKYINDRIYVGVEQNLGENTTGVRIEVELTPHLNLQSKSTTQSSRVGLGWKKDY